MANSQRRACCPAHRRSIAMTEECAVWYAVQVVTGREEATLAQLMRACEQAGLSGEIEEAFVPKRVVFEGQLAHARRVERALFPGYLILVTSRGMVSRVARVARSIPGFARVLASDGAFVPLLPEETDWICADPARRPNDRRQRGVRGGRQGHGRVRAARGPGVDHRQGQPPQEDGARGALPLRATRPGGAWPGAHAKAPRASGGGLGRSREALASPRRALSVRDGHSLFEREIGTCLDN